MTDRRAANRAAMPTVASFVDELRQQGQSVTVSYANENGITVGKKPENENVFLIPPNYCKPAAEKKEKK